MVMKFSIIWMKVFRIAPRLRISGLAFHLNLFPKSSIQAQGFQILFSRILVQVNKCEIIVVSAGLKVVNFYMCSTDHENCPAHKLIVGVLTIFQLGTIRITILALNIWTIGLIYNI